MMLIWKVFSSPFKLLLVNTVDNGGLQKKKAADKLVEAECGTFSVHCKSY